MEGVDPAAKRRVEFATKVMTDAFSPSNFLFSNPAALREAIDTKGESIAEGMKNLAADIERGGGPWPSPRPTTRCSRSARMSPPRPARSIFQNDIIQLLQFSPSTEQVFEVPLLIFPPWINKFYILDLRPENSMIRWLTDQGFTVFVTSWVNPDASLAAKTFEDYLNEGIYAAVDAVTRQTGVEDGQHRRLLHRRHPALLRPGPHGGAGRRADRLGDLLRRPAGLLGGGRPAASSPIPSG